MRYLGRAILRAVFLTALTLGVLAVLIRFEGRSPPPKADCRIGWIYDGDTVELLCGELSEAARVQGLDTPETKNARCDQEFAAGKRATERLRELISNGVEVNYTMLGRDKYQRPLIRLTVDGRDVADVLVEEGLAVSYRGGQRPNWCERLGSSERGAR